MVRDEAMNGKEEARLALAAWQEELRTNCYRENPDFRHTVAYHLPDNFPSLDQTLADFAKTVVEKLEPLVRENNLSENLPRIIPYDAIGQQVETIFHHPSYEAAGNLIYGSGLMNLFSKKGEMTEGLSFLFLSAHAGEAGHNCPIACSAGIIRILQKVGDFPDKNKWLEKLIAPSYSENFTGAQFVTEIQGGSDAGANAVDASQDDEGNWRITGEKWFCSNANADLMLITARFDPSLSGTKGLGLFLVPARLESGERNRYTFRRLKDKLGTRSMATAEIDFDRAFAIPMGEPQEGFKLLMENVLHISRLFNTICVLGMARRAYQIAFSYAKHREAFGKPILSYPLVQENLARIKAENTALLASIFATAALQDQADREGTQDHEKKLLLRLLANLNKYLSALWSVEHIHHCLDVLAGNGTIESFSSIPLLLRDCIICENWEGTHNVLRMQILRDILKYKIDTIFLKHIRSHLDQIDLASTHKKTLEDLYSRLEAELSTLKGSSPSAQSLQIKRIVDQMGILFAATTLHLEAIDQERKGSNSKMSCLKYFLFLHGKEGLPQEDQQQLKMMENFLSLT